MHDSISVIALIAGVFLLAGVVKGVIGMGLPLLGMGLLGLVMPPVQAAALLVVPSFVTNVWQLAAGPAFAAVFMRFATMMLAICIGTSVGIGLLTGGATPIAAAALGAVLALYGVIGLASARFTVPPRSEKWLSPAIGFITGILTGATGVFAIPAVPYFSALGLEKEQLIQTLGLSFTVSTVALAVGLALSGELRAAVAGGSLLALIPALGGMFFGQRLRHRLHPDVFRRWFLAGLVLLGAYMVVRAVASSYT